MEYVRTSVSSDFSIGLFAGEWAPDDKDRPQNPLDGDASVPPPPEPAFWIPAFSFSWSDQLSIDARRFSISNRLVSPRGVVMYERSTLVTRRRSTFVSLELLRSRRRASTRCSFMITAG